MSNIHPLSKLIGLILVQKKTNTKFYISDVQEDRDLLILSVTPDHSFSLCLSSFEDEYLDMFSFYPSDYSDELLPLSLYDTI